MKHGGYIYAPDDPRCIKTISFEDDANAHPTSVPLIVSNALKGLSTIVQNLARYRIQPICNCRLYKSSQTFSSWGTSSITVIIILKICFLLLGTMLVLKNFGCGWMLASWTARPQRLRSRTFGRLNIDIVLDTPRSCSKILPPLWGLAAAPFLFENDCHI